MMEEGFYVSPWNEEESISKIRLYHKRRQIETNQGVLFILFWIPKK